MRAEELTYVRSFPSVRSRAAGANGRDRASGHARAAARNPTLAKSSPLLAASRSLSPSISHAAAARPRLQHVSFFGVPAPTDPSSCLTHRCRGHRLAVRLNPRSRCVMPQLRVRPVYWCCPSASLVPLLPQHLPGVRQCPPRRWAAWPSPRGEEDAASRWRRHLGEGEQR